MLAGEVVRGERAGCEKARRDSDRVEPDVLPDLRDERQPGEGERKGGPDTPPHGLVPYEPRPQRDEHRGGELEQEADPDREPLDRDEVEPLDEGEADDAVDDEQGDLVAGDAKPPRGGQREKRGEADERSGRAELRQAQARHARST